MPTLTTRPPAVTATAAATSAATAAAAPPVPAQLAGIEQLRLQAPIFVSDLHLSRTRARTTERFLELLGQIDGHRGELLILGDLFEFWAGDEVLVQQGPDDRIGHEVAQALHRLSAGGTQVYLMHGNRDVLLGSGFLQMSGAQLLADPCVATILAHDGAVALALLLSHGDAYCTLDLPYQAFRRQARDAQFQASFLARSLDERRALLGQARLQSEVNKKHIAEHIMDVTPAAIDAALRAVGVQVMVHGHTHRPARHDFLLDQQAAVRWVLPDWELDAAPQRGGGLRWRDGALQTFTV